MVSSSELVTILTTRIAENTAKIDQYLKSKNLPPLSFDNEPQNDILVYPPDIDASRRAIVDASQELTELFVGPRDTVVSLGYGQAIKPAILRFLSHYGVHRVVPESGSISLSEIAKQINVNVYITTHMVRAAISQRIFREDTPGQISHNAASRFMLNPLAEDFIWTICEQTYPAIYTIVEGLRADPNGDDPALSAWMVWQKPAERSWFEWLQGDPIRAKRFANSTFASQSLPGHALSHVTSNYNWAGLGNKAVVVEMGGSDGRLARAILESAPQLHYIVQDLPHVIAQAQQQELEKPGNYPSSHLRFMAHDFFNEQPIKHADVYVMRAVLHDWSDRVMRRIMQQLIPALKPGAKILINDDILAPVGEGSLTAERNQRTGDLAMLAVCAAGARELDEWKYSIRFSDPRLVVTQIIRPSGATHGIIEITWQP